MIIDAFIKFGDNLLHTSVESKCRKQEGRTEKSPGWATGSTHDKEDGFHFPSEGERKR